ncbi:transposase [Megasphaera sp.]|uniref:transposase n=2 Tax=Megasphaera sp. TaxID=2023260 RepID=UPI00307A25DC
MHLLYLLFVKKMKSEDLLTALHDEYDIDLTAKGKEDVTTMCNLGEGLYERAMEKGIERGVEQEKRNSERKDREAALEMIKDGLSFEQIARYMKLSIEAVAEIAQKNKLI